MYFYQVIQDGEIVGYIGSNGAGKSTTIKMMTGILSPTYGKCLVNGIDPNKNRKENAKNIGVVFGQRTQLWWDLPLSESFTILKEIYNVSDEDSGITEPVTKIEPRSVRKQRKTKKIDE